MREEFGTGRKSRSHEPVWVLFRQRRTPEVPATPSDEMMFRQADAAFGIAQMPLDLTRRHPARVEREDLLVEAVKERAYLGTIRGSKLASRSLGSSTVTGPSTVRNVFAETPLRRFGCPSGGSPPAG